MGDIREEAKTLESLFELVAELCLEWTIFLANQDPHTARSRLVNFLLPQARSLGFYISTAKEKEEGKAFAPTIKRGIRRVHRLLELIDNLADKVENGDWR